MSATRTVLGRQRERDAQGRQTHDTVYNARMKPDRFVLVALVVATIGCSSNRIVITQSRASTPGPIERLDVYVSLPANGNRGIYYGVQKVLPSQLTACSVASTITSGMPADREANDTSSSATARLIIGWGSGELSTVTTKDEYGNTLDDKAFNEMEMDLFFELRDFTQGRVTWLAFATLHMESSGNLVGEDLARAIVARLRTDGVLKSCR
jgi:hypothetical protein